LGWNAQLLVTLAAGMFILPFFIFSATAGQLADKFSKSQLLPIYKFFEIILMVIAAFSFYWHSVFTFMLVLFLLGAQAAFFGPVKYAILPEALSDNELIAGNALIEAGTSEDKARAAARAMTNYESRFSKIEGDVNLLKWMIGFNLAFTVAILFKIFS